MTEISSAPRLHLNSSFEALLIEANAAPHAGAHHAREALRVGVLRAGPQQGPQHVRGDGLLCKRSMKLGLLGGGGDILGQGLIGGLIGGNPLGSWACKGRQRKQASRTTKEPTSQIANIKLGRQITTNNQAKATKQPTSS